MIVNKYLIVIYETCTIVAASQFYRLGLLLFLLPQHRLLSRDRSLSMAVQGFKRVELVATAKRVNGPLLHGSSEGQAFRFPSQFTQQR
jgi:hypothetical protein